MKLTEDQKKQYLEHGGYSCLYCESTNITSEPLDPDARCATAEVTCKACKKTWTDVYTLTHVIEANEGEQT